MILQICCYIQQMHNFETTFAGLRAIISFLTELVAEKVRHNADEEAERQSFLKATQAALVRITISALIQVQFISLFLNVGRQLEPHHFKSLFPLALAVDREGSDQVLSLQDLFDMAVEDGSFSVPGAALPLFSNKKIVHSLCVNLLHHCINKILQFGSANELDIKCLREECRSIQQLYCYTIKIEDSEKALQLASMEGSFGEIVVDDNFDHANEESLEYESIGGEYSMVGSVTDTSFEDHLPEQISPGRISRFASRLIKPLISSKRSSNESAISEAASAFIFSRYKDGTQQYSEVVPEDSREEFSESGSSVFTADEENDITAYFENEQRAFSACGVVGMSIISTVFLVQEVSPEIIINGLRNIAMLCLLLNNDNEALTSSSTQVDDIQELIGGLSRDDFMDSMRVLENMSSSNEDFISVDSPETAFMAATFMELFLVHGSKQWDVESSEAIIEVVSAILSRQENAPEIVTFAPLLSMLMVVACHVANRRSLLFADDTSRCALADLYYAGLEAMEEDRE